MFDLNEKIKEYFLGGYNKKVTNETLNEYLNSLTKKELIGLISVNALGDLECDLDKIVSLKNKQKKYIIDYTIKNLEIILENFIKIIKDVEIEQLKFIINNNNKKISLEAQMVSIHFIHLLKTFAIVKIEYNKKDDSIKCFMPEEFISIFRKCFDNKKLLKINKHYNDIFKYVDMLANAYGIITLSKFHEIFESQMYKIDKDELIHVIEIKCILGDIFLYSTNDNALLCSMEFDDKVNAFAFYEKQSMNYRIYTKRDYELINSGNYVYKLKSYKKFVEYLLNHFMGIDEDIEYIKEWIIIDYIYSAQVNMDVADNKFRRNIVEIIEADYLMIEHLLTLIKNIYNEYPKWIKRGNI